MAAAADLESSLELSLTGSGALPGGLPPARSRIFKIIVIGDSNVGKTCLTYRFCAGRFPQRTEATIGVDFRERAVTIDGERIKVPPHPGLGPASPGRDRPLGSAAAAGLRPTRPPGPGGWQEGAAPARRGAPAPCRQRQREAGETWARAGDGPLNSAPAGSAAVTEAPQSQL